jgi:hypothetical protein
MTIKKIVCGTLILCYYILCWRRAGIKLINACISIMMMNTLFSKMFKQMLQTRMSVICQKFGYEKNKRNHNNNIICIICVCVFVYKLKSLLLLLLIFFIGAWKNWLISFIMFNFHYNAVYRTRDEVAERWKIHPARIINILIHD